MKPTFALDLTHDGIVLIHRTSGGWGLVGEVALDDPAMTDSLARLRGIADELSDGPVTTKLIIPNSQILYTVVEAPGPDDSTREVQIREALEGLTPYDVTDLVFDWRAEGDTARVAVLARETMDEAEGFAGQFGFNPVSFVARPERGTFSGEPFFGATRGAKAVIGAGERVIPDATPVPRNPAPIALPETEAAAPAPAPEPAPVVPPAPEAVVEPVEPAAIAASAEVSPEPVANEPEAVEAPAEAPEPDAPKADTKPAPKVRTPRRPAGGDLGPAVLAPFPPTPDEKPEPVMPPKVKSPPRAAAPAAPKVTPPAPEPKAEAPALPKVSAPSLPEADPAPKTPDAPPSFSTRRSTSDADAWSPVPEATPVSEPDPVIEPPADEGGIGSMVEAQSQSASLLEEDTVEVVEPEVTQDAAPIEMEPLPPRATEPQILTPRPAPLVIDDAPPKAVMPPELEKRRLAMARALSGEADPDDEKAPGRFSGRISGIAGSISARREARAGEREARKIEAKAAEAEATRAAITAPLPKPAPEDEAAEKPARGLRRKSKVKEEPAEPTAREKEAEAMTVFGARRTQSTQRGRPKYLGLVLTLGLLLLLAAVALWSSIFLGDDDVALFNPDPVSQPQVAAVDPAAEAPVDENPALDAEPAADTAAVMSVEEAEASYATTGVWQRAPDPLDDPDGSGRSEDVYVASIDPTVEASDALSLPDPRDLSAAMPDPAIPPPPPGTSFDLNDRGLVVPTPEGAVSPTGAVVFSGAPPVTPAPRPENIAPADVQEDAALVVDPQEPGLRPRARPGNLVELAERARLGGQSLAELAESRPRARPDDIDPSVLAALADAAAATAAADAGGDEELADSEPDADTEIQLENVTELAVASSPRPGHKPSNFTQVVARVQEATSNDAATSDEGGAQVIAASAATTQPRIPSSASVANTATMKNALNLRQINLIGIYGSNNSRRALVRMSSGRYVKVAIGDRLDGGQVTSISSSRLIYQKGGRAYALDVIPLG